MSLQERPICFFFECMEVIEHDPVFEAPCGHEDCPSAIFHGLCLMHWREFKEDMEREIMRFVARHEAPGDDDA